MEFEAVKENGKLVISGTRDYVSKFPDGQKFVVTIEKKRNKRTHSQNNAMHLYFTHLAQELNGAGYTVRKFLAMYKVDLEWTPHAVKELIWRAIQVALFGKKSTTELNKQEEIDAIYEHVNRFTAQIGVHVPFPTDEQRQKEKQYAGVSNKAEYPADYKPTAFD